MHVVSVSDFRLQATKIICRLQTEREIGIRRHYNLVARLSLPNEDKEEGAVMVESLRGFRERISAYLDELTEGKVFVVRQRGRSVLLVEPAEGSQAEKRKAGLCQISFRDLSPQQTRKLLEVLEPHLEKLKDFGIEMQFN